MLTTPFIILLTAIILLPTAFIKLVTAFIILSTAKIKLITAFNILATENIILPSSNIKRLTEKSNLITAKIKHLQNLPVTYKDIANFSNVRQILNNLRAQTNDTTLKEVIKVISDPKIKSFHDLIIYSRENPEKYWRTIFYLLGNDNAYKTLGLGTNNNNENTNSEFPHIYEVVCKDCDNILRKSLNAAHIVKENDKKYHVVYECSVGNTHQSKKIHFICLYFIILCSYTY